MRDLNRTQGTRQTRNTDNARLHWCRALLFSYCAAVSWLRVNRRQTACNDTLLWRTRTYRPKKTDPTLPNASPLLVLLIERLCMYIIYTPHRIYTVLVFTKRISITVKIAIWDGNVCEESEKQFHVI